jgi:hypothetical protein
METTSILMTIYEQFIEYCKSETFDSECYEKHHIVPKHSGGTNDKENLIYLPPHIHTLSHYYRWLAFQEIGDKVAYEMRWNQDIESVKLRSQLAVETNKEKGNLFWNSEWQREQGLKGGTKGGSANTQNQFIARQKVGKTYGKQVGLSRQKSDLVEILKHSTTWKHKTGKTVILPPQESVTKLCEELQDIEYFDTPNKSLIGKLLRGEKKQLYGWFFTGMAISSQVSDTSEKGSETT